MNDAYRAAIISFVGSIFPVLELAGVTHFTSDQISAVMLLVGNGLTLAALVVKTGQSAG